VFIIIGVARHSSAIAYAGLIAVGIAVVIAAVQAPLILATVARQQRKATESGALPPGTLFAAYASQLGYLADPASGPAESRSGLRRGLLALDTDGVQFRTSGTVSEPWDTTLTWGQIERIDAGPASSPVIARLTVITTDGETVNWRVGGLDKLSAALDGLRQDQQQADHPAAEVAPEGRPLPDHSSLRWLAPPSRSPGVIGFRPP
jgi:hypothetical protein